MTPPRRHAAPLLVLAAAVLCGCGYTVGNAFQAQVRTVAVPMIQSESFRRGIEYQLTDAVKREIQNRTPFRLADESAADTRLVAKVVQFEKYPLTNTIFDDPRQLEMSLAVEVRWEDLRNGTVLACQQIPISPDAVSLISTADFAPEVGQSRATAERQAVDTMARQIVDLMETPW